MQTLQRVLATSVVEALERREHVIVAPGRTDALADEVEGIIAPSLKIITAHLEPNQQVLGEITSTFGHEAADEAVESAVDQITDRLMESDHVDDIFAEDRLIRRDSFRAIQAVLMLYVRGELDVVDDEAEADHCKVELDRLGYLVATVAQRAEPELLNAALSRAAATLGAELVRLDETERAATFSPGVAEADIRLPLEEAITEQFVELVDGDLVELPTMERILRMPASAAKRRGFAEALQGAAHRTQQLTGCAAACTVVDSETLLATLTPLSEDGARLIEPHFDTFLDNLEQAIAALAAVRPEERRSSRARKSDSSRRSAPPSSRRASKPPSSRKAAPPSSRRASKPPASAKPAAPSKSRKSAKAAPSRSTKPPSSRKPAAPPKSRKSAKAAPSRSTKPPSSAKPAMASAARKSTKTAPKRTSKPPSSRKPASVRTGKRAAKR